jgi:glycerol-3-phosphate dehydrogenase (NAD(P)+)
MNNSPITVIGAGSWGTALAIHLARNNQHTRLWGRDINEMKSMQSTRCNSHYLPNVLFPEKLTVYTDLGDVLANVNDILIAVPSHGFRDTLTLIKPYLHENSRIVWATKGLDPTQHQLLHEVFNETFDELPFAILSGPTFAKEVACDLPTAVTIASLSPIFSKDLLERFHSKTFRVYTSTDVIGVQLGGAMKNVLAIAVGIADGLGYGANARAALITRGLAEIVRLGLVIGGRPETFMGLTGLGDLVLTCTDNQSRNRRFGLGLGAGKKPEDVQKEIGQVVEGVRTTSEIYFLAKKYNVEVPISKEIYRVLYENISPQMAVDHLLSREPKIE